MSRKDLILVEQGGGVDDLVYITRGASRSAPSEKAMLLILKKKKRNNFPLFHMVSLHTHFVRFLAVRGVFLNAQTMTMRPLDHTSWIA